MSPKAYFMSIAGLLVFGFFVLGAYVRSILSARTLEPQPQVQTYAGGAADQNPFTDLRVAPAGVLASPSITSADPMFGSSEAPVKIVQFSDFQCPFCAAATATVYTLMKEYEGKIALVWKDFPLPTHPMAQRAALAAACAGRQGEFWEYHDYLFDHQETLSEETLTAAAKKVGVNLPVFETCMQGALPSQQISANFNEGVQLGIDQVPYFFIGEHRVAGAADAALFKDIIDRELKKVMK